MIVNLSAHRKREILHSSSSVSSCRSRSCGRCDSNAVARSSHITCCSSGCKISRRIHRVRGIAVFFIQVDQPSFICMPMKVEHGHCPPQVSTLSSTNLFPGTFLGEMLLHLRFPLPSFFLRLFGHL